MKRLGLAACGLCVGAALWGESAEPALFPSGRLDVLAALVSSDRDAAALYAPLKRTADRALSETPRPIVKLQSEGKLDKDPVKIATGISLADMNKLYALAVVYRLSHDERYLEKTKEFLLDWARVNRATGDPIDETSLEPAVRAYDLIRASCSADETIAVDGWLNAVADAEIASRHPKSDTSFNNWNSHRLKIVGLIGLVLGNAGDWDYARSGYREQVERDLYPDGRSWDLEERDALHYHCYTLEPLLALVIAAAVHGEDWFSYVSPSGSTLRLAVEYLLPYASGEKEHPEFAHSKVRFDQERAAAGQRDYQPGHPFQVHEALRALGLYSYFDPSVIPLAGRIAGNSPPYPTWDVLVMAVLRS